MCATNFWLGLNNYLLDNYCTYCNIVNKYYFKSQVSPRLFSVELPFKPVVDSSCNMTCNFNWNLEKCKYDSKVLPKVMSIMYILIRFESDTLNVRATISINFVIKFYINCIGTKPVLDSLPLLDDVFRAFSSSAGDDRAGDRYGWLRPRIGDAAFYDGREPGGVTGLKGRIPEAITL